jgi:hypothetical protein
MEAVEVQVLNRFALRELHTEARNTANALVRISLYDIVPPTTRYIPTVGSTQFSFTA